MADVDVPRATVAVTEGDDGVVLISLAGDLDLASVERIRSVVVPRLTQSPDRVVVDLHGLSFMDSSGIALLVEISNRVDDVTIVNVAPIVRRILEVTGLVEYFGLET